MIKAKDELLELVSRIKYNQSVIELATAEMKIICMMLEIAVEFIKEDEIYPEWKDWIVKEQRAKN